MLYDPTQFEVLTDEPWRSASVEDGIASIVADADAAFDREALWPAHEWEGWEEPLPLKTLYVGAAGVIWALDALRGRGHAETSLDLGAAALRTLELKRAAPDFTADEHYHPAALGGRSARDVQGAACPPWWRRAVPAGRRLPRARHAARCRRQHARAAPPRARRDPCWRDGRRSRPACGPRARLRQLARLAAAPARRSSAVVHRRSGNPRRRLAVSRRRPAPRRRRADLAGRRAPGRQGHGICHGTSGNGFALLQAFARTGDERWLERARRFAVHALAQAEELADANGRRRYSLFTGDVGTALFAAACLDLDPRYPILDIL